MTRSPTLSRLQCACGHVHHDPDDLARIGWPNAVLICRCLGRRSCFDQVVIAAKFGVQLRAFDTEAVIA